MKRKFLIYDNGGKTIDRYTVVYLGDPEGKGLYAARAMDDKPFSASGFGQMTTAMPGMHLGVLIPFAQLPPDCKRLVMQDLED